MEFSLLPQEGNCNKNYHHIFLPSLIYLLFSMFLCSELKWKTQAKSKDWLISTKGNKNKHIHELLFTSQTKKIIVSRRDYEFRPLVSIIQS